MMRKLELSKLESAGRQLLTAVDLFFAEADPVAIHTLTCAAYNILRDLNKARKGAPMIAKDRYAQLSGILSISDLNAPENFFKHADRDAEAILVFYPKYTECLLVDACEKYQELSDVSAMQLLLFTLWFMCHDPDQFDIPSDWESFAKDAKRLVAEDDRTGFRNLFVAQQHARSDGR